MSFPWINRDCAIFFLKVLFIQEDSYFFPFSPNDPAILSLQNINETAAAIIASRAWFMEKSTNKYIKQFLL